MYKKIFALILALVTMLSISACGKSDDNQKNDDYTIVENTDNQDYGDRDTIAEEEAETEAETEAEEDTKLEIDDLSDTEIMLNSLFGSPMRELVAEPKPLTLNMSENLEYYDMYTSDSKGEPIQILVPDHNIYKESLGKKDKPIIFNKYNWGYGDYEVEYLFNDEADSAEFFRYTTKLNDSIEGVPTRITGSVTFEIRDRVHDKDDYAEDVVSFINYNFSGSDREKKGDDVLHGLITNYFGGSTVTNYQVGLREDRVETCRATNITQLVDSDKVLNIEVVIHANSEEASNEDILKMIDDYVNSSIDEMEYSIFESCGLASELEMIRESDVINP